MRDRVLDLMLLVCFVSLVSIVYFQFRTSSKLNEVISQQRTEIEELKDQSKLLYLFYLEHTQETKIPSLKDKMETH